MPILMLLLGMVSSIVIVAFALQNGRIVTVGFFDWSVEASLVLVIMVSAAMGFVTAVFFELFIQIKLRYRLYKMGRQLKQAEDELVALKQVAATHGNVMPKPTDDGNPKTLGMPST